MNFKIARFDASYEGLFHAPLFDLAKSNVELISSLYASISPRFAIATSDLQVIGGTAVSDVRIRISLFQGHGVIDVSADKFKASFTGARGREDVETINDATALALRGFDAWGANKISWAEKKSFRQEAIIFNHSVDFLATADDITEFFAQESGQKTRLDAGLYGATEVRPAMRLELSNAADAWRLTIDLLRTWGEASTSGLLITNGMFDDGTPHKTLQEKGALIFGCTSKFLETLRMVRSPEPQENEA